MIDTGEWASDLVQICVIPFQTLFMIVLPGYLRCTAHLALVIPLIRQPDLCNWQCYNVTHLLRPSNNTSDKCSPTQKSCIGFVLMLQSKYRTLNNQKKYKGYVMYASKKASNMDEGKGDSKMKKLLILEYLIREDFIKRLHILWQITHYPSHQGW